MNGSKSGPKWVSIIIAPHNRAGSWNLRVPSWALWALLGFCIAGVAGIVGLAFLYRDYRVKTHRIMTLEEQRDDLLEAAERMAILEDEVLSLSEFNRQIREWVGLPADTSLFVATGEREPGIAFGGSPAAYRASILVGGWEWPARGWISRGFDRGSRKAPAHLGVDIVGGKEEPIRAARAGRVTFCGWDDRLGNLIMIEHDKHYISIYGHNSKILTNEGDVVRRGQQIAVLGSTGMSSAPHLHFEIRKDGESIDPMSVIEE